MNTRLIKNETSGTSVNVIAFETGKDFLDFLRESPVALQNAMGAVESYFRYHVVNSPIRENMKRRQEAASEAFQKAIDGGADEDAAKALAMEAARAVKLLPVPLSLPVWLASERQAAGGEATKADIAEAKAHWEKITAKLTEAMAKIPTSETAASEKVAKRKEILEAFAEMFMETAASDVSFLAGEEFSEEWLVSYCRSERLHEAQRAREAKAKRAALLR